jgi:hypothetical protein
MHAFPSPTPSSLPPPLTPPPIPLSPPLPSSLSPSLQPPLRLPISPGSHLEPLHERPTTRPHLSLLYIRVSIPAYIHASLPTHGCAQPHPVHSPALSRQPCPALALLLPLPLLPASPLLPPRASSTEPPCDPLTRPTHLGLASLSGARYFAF